MGAERTAVIGVGQTRHVSARHDVSIAGLVREAAQEALEDAGLDWGDIDAVVIGKAPDMFEGVVMPELYLADALGATGKPMIRVHTAGQRRRLDRDRRGEARDGRGPRAGAHRRVREAVREQRDLGALGRDAVPGAARRGCRRLLRADHPRVHPPVRRARAHRAPRVGEGPAQRAAQPEGAAAPARHRPQDGRRSRCCSGRRSGSSTCARAPTARWRWSSAASRPPPPRPGPVAWIHGTAMRSEPTMFAGRDQVNPQAGQGLRGRRLRAGRDHEPARGLRLRRGLRAVLLVRADVAREPRVLRRGRRLEAHRGGRDRARRRHPVEPVGRRALVEPDRRVAA